MSESVPASTPQPEPPATAAAYPAAAANPAMVSSQASTEQSWHGRTPMRPLRGIGGATRGLLVAYVVLSVLMILVKVWGIDQLVSYSAGAVGIDALQTYDQLSAALNIVALIAMAGSGICWLVWQHRAASSQPAGTLRRSPGWHVGAWFVPFISLWWPYQNISDLARSTRASLGGATLRAWWALWIIGPMVSGVSGRVLFGAHTLSTLIGALTIEIVDNALLIGAAALASFVVTRITRAVDVPDQ